MLDIVVKFFCAMLLTISGFFIIKNILKSPIKIWSMKNTILLIIMSGITFLLHKSDYVANASIIYLIFMIIIYQQVFGISLTKAVVSCSMMLAIIFLADAVSSLIIINIASLEEIRTVWSYMLLGNVMVSGMSILIASITIIREKLFSVIDKVHDDKFDDIIVFILIAILALSILNQNFGENYKLNGKFIMLFLLIVLFIIMLCIYIKEKNYSRQINNQYQMLWDHVEIYENAIENDKMTRHELKNTLGSIRNMTKNKNIIERIDDILQDVNKIDDSWIEELKNLPKGTLKALLYYKMSVAREKGIHIIVDVSPKMKRSIEKFKNSKDICNLLGIYVDNAIEAADSSKKKEVAIEIYRLQDILYFTISNTFGKILELEQIGKKGISTKGKGRGNGLSYAARIIKNNEFISETHNVKNKYYITKLMIDLEESGSTR